MTEKNKTFATKSIIGFMTGNESSLGINTEKDFAQ
jgi:hypothetical protein